FDLSLAPNCRPTCLPSLFLRARPAAMRSERRLGLERCYPGKDCCQQLLNLAEASPGLLQGDDLNTALSKAPQRAQHLLDAFAAETVQRPDQQDLVLASERVRQRLL